MKHSKYKPGSLTSLLAPSQELSSISTLFTQKIPEPEEREDIDSLALPYIDENASALLNKDRAEKTLFVGNIDVKATKKDIKRFFMKYGNIEKLWERSLPVNNESKLPMKAKAIVKDFAKDIENLVKNCYILFEDKEAVAKAVKDNGVVFMGRHIRLDYCGIDKQQPDYETSVFIGNLPYQVDEESLRGHFADCGEIIGLRVIRDPVTHVGKGFGYIRFKTKEAYKKALNLNNSIFVKRIIRVRKALEPEKLEEREKKKEMMKKPLSVTRKNAERRLEKKQKKSLKSLQNFADNNTLERNELEHLEYKNIITLNKGTIRKKIRKEWGRNGTQAQKTEYLSQADKAMSKKHDKNLFNDVDQLDKRRKLRKKKADFNRLKIKKSRKSEDK